MKCDELKAYKGDVTIPVYGTIADADVYLKEEADAAIAEKDREIAELKKKLMPCLNGDCILTCEVVEKYGKENAELKKENERLKDELEAANNQCENLINSATDIMLRQDKANDAKCDEIESLKATHYTEMVEAGMENRRLQRALYIARANRALEKIAWFRLWNAGISTMNPEDGARQEYDKWKKNLGKFLKKAEEYK